MLFNFRSMARFVLLAALLPMPALADDGHGHGEAPQAPTGPAAPRFAAVSDHFELVGVVDGRQLTVYLDRFEDNAPLKSARIALDIGGERVSLEEHADGEFEGTLDHALAEGMTPVSATIDAGGRSDTLATGIDIHAAARAEPATPHGTARYAIGGVLALALLLTALAWRRHRAAARALTAHAGGAA